MDEPALCEILESQGWIIARLGDTPLRHQIELFKAAEVIAGVLGAGLTNLVFASSYTKSLSFVPSQMPDIFYWMLSQLKRQSFSEVRCEQEYGGREEFNWNCKLLMTSEEALVFINDILNTRVSPIILQEAPWKAKRQAQRPISPICTTVRTTMSSWLC